MHGMQHHVRGLAAAVPALVIAFVVAACGASGGGGTAQTPPAPATTKGPASTPGASDQSGKGLNLTFTGAIAGSMTQGTPQCDVVGAGADFSWTGPVGGSNVTILFNIAGYHGPAGYQVGPLYGQGKALVDARSDSVDVSTAKVAADAGKVTVDSGEKTGTVDTDLQVTVADQGGATAHVSGTCSC